LNIIITGASSGVGKCLADALEGEHRVFRVTREIVNLDYPEASFLTDLPFDNTDILINCAGHDMGGKVPFADHLFGHWTKIINTNLISAMRLSQLAIQSNENVTIVNITSTNIDQYYPGDLVYSLTKNALQQFGEMLQLEYPTSTIKEVRLGLTKTNFNNNRHKVNHKPIDNLYDMPHLSPEYVATEIYRFIFSDETFIRIAP